MITLLAVRIAELERQLAEMQRDLDICRLANGYETEATELAEIQLEEAQARIAQLEAEVESLRQAADERFQAQWREGVGNPFYEAAAVAADQRLTALKHEARANLDRAEAAADKLACAERELRQRRGVYPRLVMKGSMKQADADREIALMKSIAEDYRAQVEDDPRGNGKLI